MNALSPFSFLNSCPNRLDISAVNQANRASLVAGFREAVQRQLDSAASQIRFAQIVNVARSALFPPAVDILETDKGAFIERRIRINSTQVVTDTQDCDILSPAKKPNISIRAIQELLKPLFNSLCGTFAAHSAEIKLTLVTAAMQTVVHSVALSKDNIRFLC